MNILPHHQKNALIAAEEATEATVELLRFRREGPVHFHPFGDPEPVAQLASALLRTTRIEQDLYPRGHQEDIAYREALGQIAAACATFLEDQCNIVIPDETPIATEAA